MSQSAGKSFDFVFGLPLPFYVNRQRRQDDWIRHQRLAWADLRHRQDTAKLAALKSQASSQ